MMYASQLRHIFTGKYVHVSATQTSRTESSNMEVRMNNHRCETFTVHTQ
jgi:hypothetical protein